MGCTQVRVKPDQFSKENRSKLIISQTRIPANQSTVSLTPMHSTSTIALDRLSVTPIIWNKSNDLTKHSFNNNNNSNNGIIKRYDTSTSRQSIFTTSTIIERKDTPISRISIIKPFDLSSNISDIPEVSSASITSSDFNPDLSNYDFVISSSKDVNQKIFYQDTIKRFLSARPKRPINHPILGYNNKSHIDVINSISTYSGESASDLAKDIPIERIQTIQYKENYHKPKQSRFHRSAAKKTLISKEKKLINSQSKYHDQ